MPFPVVRDLCPIVQVATAARGFGMILLERLMQGLDIAVRPFAVCRVGAGRQIDLGRSETAAIHYLLSGAGRIHLSGHRDIDLAAGHAVIVPAATAQRFAAAGEGHEAASASDLLVLDEPVRDGEAVMVCGTVGATYRTGHGLFEYLPEPIAVDGTTDSVFATAFESLLGEMLHPQPGSDTLIRALMQQCLVLVLRRYCESGECRVPWLSALEDERLARAVEAMVDSPEAPHGRAFGRRRRHEPVVVRRTFHRRVRARADRVSQGSPGPPRGIAARRRRRADQGGGNGGGL